MFINSPTDGRDAYGGLGLFMDDIAYQIRQQIVSHWLFNSGGLLVDSVGTNTLTNVSSVSQSLVDFKEGDASALYGASNDYFSVSSNPSLVGNQDFTISLWVNFPSFALPQALASKDAATVRREYNLFTVSTKLRFGVSTGGTTAIETIESVEDLSISTWYHIAATHNLTNKFIELFVNGVRSSSTTYSLTTGSSTESFKIGSDGRAGGLSLLNGVLIDNFIWCQSVLTSAQIRYLYLNPTFN